MDEQERQQLNREILEVLGYYVKPIELPVIGTRWVCCRPNGEEIYSDMVSYSESEAWDDAPFFPADLNAVADALKPHMATLKLDFETNSAEIYDYPDGVNGIGYFAHAAPGTIEEAAAKATLSWALATKARG